MLTKEISPPCPVCTVGVLECLPLAAAYGLDEIYRKSLRWITKYFVRVWPTKGFATLPRELLDKCYKQHVVHMTVDNVLETLLCCNKLQSLIPNVRWSEPVYALCNKLYEAAVKFVAQHFCDILSSDMFMSMSKEQLWTMSHLEEILLSAADKLPPDQACKCHSHLYKLTVLLHSSSSPFEIKNDGFLEFLGLLSTTVESCLLKQAARASRTPAWTLMEPHLRHKIQDSACLVIVPGDDRRRARHLLKRGEATTATNKRITDAVSARSNATEVKKAVPLRASLPASNKPQKPPQATNKTEISGPRPRTWPYKVSEVKSRYLEPKQTPKQSPALTSTKQDKTSSLTSTTRRTMSKSIISSSDSSRTSSPAMHRSAPQRPLRVPSKDLIKKEDTLTMSTDSLADPSTSGTQKKLEAGPSAIKTSKIDFVERNVRAYSAKASNTKVDSFGRSDQSESRNKSTGDKPKYSPLTLNKRVGSRNTSVVKGSPVPAVKSAVNSPVSPLNQQNTLSPKEKPFVGSDTKSTMLKRTATYRVQDKSSPLIKTTPSKTREPILTPPNTKKNINKIQPKTASCKKSAANSNILNNNKTDRRPQPMVGSRSGTFLKDEPSVLKKPLAVNVSE